LSPFHEEDQYVQKLKQIKKRATKNAKKKKNFNKLFLKEKSPHNQNIIWSPIGIIVNKLVITVAPHKDI